MDNSFERKVEKILRKGHSAIKHYRQKIQTEVLLKSIEAEKGKISEKIKKLSREYAQDILGWTGYSPWLNVYSAIAGEFKEGWIPDNYYGWVVVPRMKGLYGETGNLKSLSSKLLNTDRLPDLLYYVNGLFFTPAWETYPNYLPPTNDIHIFSVSDMIKKYLFEHNNRVIYKQDDSSQGLGIHILTRETFDIEKIYKWGNGVFQKYIRQHKFFNDLMPNSVSTLRITSVIENSGRVSCRAVYLRIGRTEDTYVKSSTAIKVPIDLITGRLCEKGYFPNWHSINYHPDTKVEFAGREIPGFNKCIEYIIKTHKSIPFCRSVGWDLIVDEDEEIQLIEWNGDHNGIKFTEATQGPCFADMGWEKLWRVEV